VARGLPHDAPLPTPGVGRYHALALSSSRVCGVFGEAGPPFSECHDDRVATRAGLDNMCWGRAATPFQHRARAHAGHPGSAARLLHTVRTSRQTSSPIALVTMQPIGKNIRLSFLRQYSRKK
jgi:hypothetical protein